MSSPDRRVEVTKGIAFTLGLVGFAAITWFGMEGCEMISKGMNKLDPNARQSARLTNEELQMIQAPSVLQKVYTPIVESPYPRQQNCFLLFCDS